MHLGMTRGVAPACVAFLLLHVAAQHSNHVEFGRPVVLVSTSIHERRADDNLHTEWLNRRSASQGDILPLLVHFNRACDGSTKEALSAVPGVVQLLHYVPHDTWLVLGQVQALDALQKLPSVSMVETLRPSDKLSLELAQLCQATSPNASL